MCNVLENLVRLFTSLELHTYFHSVLPEVNQLNEFPVSRYFRRYPDTALSSYAVMLKCSVQVYGSSRISHRRIL